MIHDYVSLVNHLNVFFSTAYTIQIKKSLTVQNFSEVDHMLLHVHSGQISYASTNKKEVIRPGQILFIPSGACVTLTYGKLHPVNIDYTQLLHNQHQYLQPIHDLSAAATATSFSCIHFRTQALQSFDLFYILQLAPLLLSSNHQIESLMQKILSERTQEDAAQARVLHLYTELLTIALLRHCNTQQDLLEKLLEKQHYFLEERLLSILQYIHANLHTDLSNHQLATIAHLSEDYMGQYFKGLMGMSPQAYIETQRLKEAMRLLRNTDQRIHHISKQVGFRDTTYFCRRFKLKFGIQANKIRGLPY